MLQTQEQLRHVEVLLKHVEPLAFTRSLLYFHTCSMGDTERSHQTPLADLQSKTPIVLNGQLGCWHISWAWHNRNTRFFCLERICFGTHSAFASAYSFSVDETHPSCRLHFAKAVYRLLVCSPSLSWWLLCIPALSLSSLVAFTGTLVFLLYIVLKCIEHIYIFLCFLYISLLGNVTLLPFSDQQVASLSFCALSVAQFHLQSLHRNSTRSRCILHSFWVRFVLSLSLSKLEQMISLIYFT